MSELLDLLDALLATAPPWPIVAAGDPVLRRPCPDYDGEIDADRLATLITGMRRTMHAAPGVGLAAPQVGLPLRLAVLEDPAPVPAEVAAARHRPPLPFRVLVNPRYEPVSDATALFYEGCLSVPGYQAAVARPLHIRLRGQDEHGTALDETLTGWPARIAGHETDHLDGRLYLDRAELRSLTDLSNYAQRWATPTPDAARAGLGF